MSTALQAPGCVPTLTAEEAHAIGVDAYIYFYPLVLMELTRKQSINIDNREFGQGPMNTFANVPAYPPADFKGVVRSNFDTLYSIVWLDLTKEPLVISAPDTGGRYYLLPMLDMWTDVFASPGWRTTGTQSGNFLVTPPGWTELFPRGSAHCGADCLCLDHRPYQDGWTGGLRRGPWDTGRVQGDAALPLGEGTRAADGEDRSYSRYEDPANGAGGHHACRILLCLRSRVAQAPPCSPDRSTYPRADGANWHGSR